MPLNMLSLALNVSRASLYRAFDSLTQDGVIEKEGKKVCINNAERLKKYMRWRNEKNTDLSDATDLIDLIRERAGMPKVDRAKYNTQAKLRELLRRERRVEFAFEGLRRDDIIRWDIAKDVLNGPIYASNQGTVDMDPSIPQEERATIFQGEKNQVVLEIRKFRNRYMPIPQAELDKNPNLKQTNFKI